MYNELDTVLKINSNFGIQAFFNCNWGAAPNPEVFIKQW